MTRALRVFCSCSALSSPGLVLFSAVIFIVTGRSPAPIAMPSAVGGPFRLVDQNGKPITEQDLKGQPFLVFFGFTHCPDVCPTALFEVSEMLRALGPEPSDVARAVRHRRSRARHAGEAQGLSVELRSARDRRHRRRRGDRGGEKAYRVYAKKVPLDGGGYTMDHTAMVYLMDKEGRFVAPFNHEAAARKRRRPICRRYL